MAAASASINCASSAYTITCRWRTKEGKSLVNGKISSKFYKIGPKYSPGLRHMSPSLALYLHPATHCVRPLSHPRNQWSSTPYHPSFSRSLQCCTLSNALDVSVVVKVETWPRSKLLTSLSTAHSIPDSVEWPGRKPCCSAQSIDARLNI